MLIVSCGTNDDSSDNNSNTNFFENALTSATQNQLEGRWSIFQIDFEGQISDVPESVPECGRDFFDFQSNGTYFEYVFNDNFECTPESNNLNWSLSNGIINFSNGFETDQWVITELTATQLIFKFRFDIDNDGEIDILKAICNRYNPPTEMDIYSNTFQQDLTIDNNDKIYLFWNAYNGYNTFEKYEILRYTEGCNTNNPEVIATITDVDTISFIDENPPALDEICYVFKIYTNQGLLGESDPITVYTNTIELSSVNLAEPVLNGNEVNLQWDLYEGFYFAQYEISVKNYTSGSGSGYQEEILAVITDINTTSLTVELPYFTNPVFVIRVRNIFNNNFNYSSIEGQNQRTTSFSRPEILPLNFIKFTEFSPIESVVYIANYSNLYKFNYTTNSIENSVELNSSSIGFIKVFESSFGTEVIVNIGNEFNVYDADLNFKYNLQHNIFSPEHLAVSENGYWLITDREKLYSFSRVDNNLQFINSNNLYNQLFNSSTINVLDIGLNRILVGNINQTQGLIIDINSDGNLSSIATPVSANLTSEWKNDALYSSSQNYIININDKTLYNTNNLNLITTLNEDFFPSGIGNNGLQILGTYNNPETLNDSFHEKKVRILSFPSFTEQEFESKGYPHIIFENHLGNIICISKGLKGNLGSSTPENDIFIEIVN